MQLNPLPTPRPQAMNLPAEISAADLCPQLRRLDQAKPAEQRPRSASGRYPRKDQTR